MSLDPSDYGRSDSVHFNRANAALDQALQSDPEFAQRMEQLIPGVQNRVSSVGGRQNPESWTWHHDESPGVLQLVPSADHWDNWAVYHPTGRGGYAIWAVPAGAPLRH